MSFSSFDNNTYACFTLLKRRKTVSIKGCSLNGDLKVLQDNVFAEKIDMKGEQNLRLESSSFHKGRAKCNDFSPLFCDRKGKLKKHGNRRKLEASKGCSGSSGRKANYGRQFQ